MLENFGLNILNHLYAIAQFAPNINPNVPEETALLFSGPRFFVALISGLVLAFAFQLLLTNFSIAAGISYLGHQDHDHHDLDDRRRSSAGGVGSTIRKISLGLGLWTLITVSIALFLACFLAVKLSLVVSPQLGAIVGLVIWAAFFTLMMWLSSTTVGSLIGSVMNTVTSGFQSLVGTATAAIGGKMMSDRMVATAEAAASAVRRELSLGLDTDKLRDTLEDYLDALRPPEANISTIRGEFERLLHDSELKGLSDSESLKHIDRQTFVELLSNRTDLSRRDVNRLADQLEASWKKFVNERAGSKNPIEAFQNYLSSALPEQLKSNDFNDKLDQLIAALKQNSSSNQGQPNQNAQGPIAQALSLGMTTLMGSVLGRKDLSDLDVEKILGQLRTVKDKVSDQGSQILGQATGQASASMADSTIRTDVENYLLNTYSWQMTPASVEQEFRQVIYDPDADPAAVRRQLESLNRGYFADLLRQRGVFTQDRIQQLADQLESIRMDVLKKTRIAEIQEQAQELHRQVQQYILTAPRMDLLGDNFQYEFARFLQNAEIETDALQAYLSRLDQNVLRQLVSYRQTEPFSPEETERVVNQLQMGCDRALAEVEARKTAEQSQIKAAQMRLENYLRNTHQESLNPEGIKRDLQTLLQDPQAGFSALQTRFSHLDRNALVQLLSQREDISEERANQILDQVESTWNSITHAPQNVASQAKDQVDQFTTRLADYLRRTELKELNPEGIQRDLALLVDHPQAGLWALRRRLSQVDRETLVKLLSQRQDLSEEQVNQAIDQLQTGIRQFVRTPRRLASRTQERVMTFEANLENYLRNTNRDELNPEGIKRDLGLLFQDPRAGLESLGDRLSRVDRASLVALLSQRQDMTEEEANRIVDQILSVRDQFMEQIRSVQYRIQSVIESIFARIRDYLNSLERPELNYEGIERDVRRLFSDPQAGFDALRDRLSHFNRDTLVAILSSREDISSSDVNRILDQVENARSNVLHRAERMQQATQERIEELKRQAQRQAAETRKAAETAAWWLFGTALTSGLLSALAGAIAVAR